MEDKIKQLEKEIGNLKEQIKILTERRINQTMIMPDVIKQRHIGEGVRFVRDFAATDLPTVGETTLQGAACGFDYTNNKWYIYNNSSDAWKSITLS